MSVHSPLGKELPLPQRALRTGGRLLVASAQGSADGAGSRETAGALDGPWAPAGGGLLSALAARGAVWLDESSLPEDLRKRAARHARAAFWPLFHDLPGAAADPADRPAYAALNRASARAVASGSRFGDLVWVDDLALLSLAAELRRLGALPRTLLYLPVPFPAPERLARHPRWRALLADLLEFDRIALPSRRDLRSFIACLGELVPAARLPAAPEGFPARRSATVLLTTGWRMRTLTVEAAPLGVDAAAVARQAALPAVVQRAAVLREGFRAGEDGRLLLAAVDPLDASRGLLVKLRGFEQALARFPELRGRASLVQVVLPGPGAPGAAEEALRREVERRVGEVNGRFGAAGWLPVRYLHRPLLQTERLALWRAADAWLQTPLKDALSLAAHEACAADLDERGALVLSEFAGAAEALAPGALLVNPHDLDGLAETVRRAAVMAPEERSRRARALRGAVARGGPEALLEALLETGGAASHSWDETAVAAAAH